MNSRLPWDVPAAYADRPTTSPTAGSKPGRRLIAAMLLAAAALDLARCGLFVMTARHPAPAAGLVAAGLAAAALSGQTARGCQAGQRWAGWAALVIGAVSAPQAAASGFHTPYTIPDTATAVLGVLLAVAVLATAGPTRWPGHNAESPCVTAGHRPDRSSWGAAGRRLRDSRRFVLYWSARTASILSPAPGSWPAHSAPNRGNGVDGSARCGGGLLRGVLQPGFDPLQAVVRDPDRPWRWCQRS